MFHATDLAALAFNIVAFAAYRVRQRRRGRHDPGATLQSQQAAIRAEWIAEVLASGNGILGVQALRNAMMGSIFFASNTMFLVIGTLGLTAQSHLAESWRMLDPTAGGSPSLALAKLLLLLLTLLVAFFAFVNAIRLFGHASISIGNKKGVPELVTAQVNTAWHYQGLGVRCYYFAVPVLFWLFGAIWFVVAGIGAVALMHQFDRHPVRS